MRKENGKGKEKRRDEKGEVEKQRGKGEMRKENGKGKGKRRDEKGEVEKEKGKRRYEK